MRWLGYSELMTKLRICIGLFATALLIGALPAHAGISFRTAKVCLQLEGGTKLSGVVIKWSPPGFASGKGTTDKNGCFTAQYLPVGLIEFKYQGFIYPNFLKGNQPLYHQGGSITEDVKPSGTISLVLPGPPASVDVLASLRDPSGNSIASTMSYFLTATGMCNEESSGGDGGLRNSNMNHSNDNVGWLRYFLTDRWLGREWNDPTPKVTWGYMLPNARLFLDRKNRPVWRVMWWATVKVTKPQSIWDLRSFETSRLISGRTINLCIKASASSGGQKLVAYGKVQQPETILTSTSYLQGFKNLPISLKVKSGKVTLATTLHDSQNQPMSGIPVTVAEPKATNPNIGKKVGSCKPVLTATTNAQGKATFTLCPTKNATVTVKAPPLGIVSQSITVSK